MNDFLSINSTELPRTPAPVPHTSEVQKAVGSAGESSLRSQLRGGLPPRILRRVREHIESNLERTLTLNNLAATAGLSTSHFVRAFKQSEGVTPHKFLLKCRLLQAVRLLAATELPISEIAIVTGFADQSHFSRQFRRNVGITPSSYRWSTR